MWVQLIQFQLHNAILDEHLRTPVLLTPFRLGSITAISTQGNEGRETETERGEEAEGRQLREAAGDLRRVEGVADFEDRGVGREAVRGGRRPPEASQRSVFLPRYSHVRFSACSSVFGSGFCRRFQPTISSCAFWLCLLIARLSTASLPPLYRWLETHG